jgi:SpoVK/Ycf46/Vps4 family AAA+-type ATPase
MATGAQLKNIIKTHFNGDKEQFSTVALRIAAHEAKNGHSVIARDIRSLVDEYKNRPQKVVRLKREYKGLVKEVNEKHYLSELIVNDDINNKIKRIVKEYKKRDKLLNHGLKNRRKILLKGPPGTGKTYTSSVLAKELNLSLFTVQLDKLVTKYLGETSAKLRVIFDMIKDIEAVFLFDEFDAIGYKRSLDNDVGEMRRVINSFLQFLENDKSKSIILAATNHPSLLDDALFRRFDDIISYKLPTEKEIYRLIKNRIASFSKENFLIDDIVKLAKGLSHSEITKACDDAIKETILNDEDMINKGLLERMIKEKKISYEN